MPLDFSSATKRPNGAPPMPKAFGSSAPDQEVQRKPHGREVAAIASGNGDDETAETQGSYTISPEALSYRGPDQKCSSCEYRDQDATCKILKIAVEDEASCNAYESGAGDALGSENDLGMGGMGDYGR